MIPKIQVYGSSIFMEDVQKDEENSTDKDVVCGLRTMMLSFL